MVLLGAAVCGAAYSGMERLLAQFSAEDLAALINKFLPQWMEFLKLVFLNFHNWVIPAVMGVFLLTGGLGWLVLSIFISPGLKKAAAQFEADVQKSAPKKGKKDFVDQRIEQERKRRLFLHTLSVLQREGRLLDFFDEDLSLYEDEQIGAAVRSIQEDCKKAVKKYIDLKPVVDGQEGDTITIEEGFDIDAINLVGNVSGQPPFQGVIKHPGWRAGKKDVPKLSDIQDPGIMTPAQIEIQ